MGRYFKAFGLIIILFISFIYTEKTVSVVKEYDEIMIEIRDKMEQYNKEGTNATIQDEGMIPGISGVKVNVNKSYSKMKRYGKFNEQLFVYDKISPEISMYDHFEYPIISGNGSKNMATLLFILKSNDDLDSVIKVLDETDTKAHFFVDNNWIEKNSISLDSLITKGHSIGNYTDVNDESFSWVDTIIKKIAKQSVSYCYMIDNKEVLDKCSKNNNFTIKPNIIIDKNLLIEVKKQLKSGSLISLEINDKNIQELKLVINYIRSKGLNIVNLNEHLKE